MAEIFLATQHGAEGFERPVVLKRILAALVADPQFRHMMIDEAHVAMSLNHSNIAQVLDLGQAKGRYFLVLELVDGWDLHHILARTTAAGFPMPAELSLFVAAQVCRALAYAHGRTRNGKPLGIVHRDVSPHNVLVSEQGEVKLTDFGIAKALGRRERTGEGIVKGKLAFMSPEQASGAALDARSDLFAVGTMVYLMATGRRPFEAPTDLEAILRVRQCDFPAPEAIKPDLPPQLAAVIKRAMKLSPAERYQNADEMLVDIEAVQRTAFRPAGQTELKRWLTELQHRDKVPPISRAAPLPTSPEDEPLDLLDEDLVFEDSKVVDQTIASGPPPHMTLPLVGTPPPLPRLASPPERAPPTTRRQGLGLLLVIGGASAGLVYYVRGELLSQGPSGGGSPTPSDGHPLAPSTSPPTPLPDPAALPTAAAPLPAVPDADSAAAVSETPSPGASPAAADPSDAGGSDAADPEDEEFLLERAEPGVAETVIGEESARVPPQKTTATPTATPTPTPSRPVVSAKKPAAEPPVVSVRIVTRPEGAVIRLGSRVFGRAPMNLRFRSGITYEMSLIKSGYLTATRRFTVTRRTKAVYTTLRKKPAKKRSFFRRLFGK